MYRVYPKFWFPALENFNGIMGWSFGWSTFYYNCYNWWFWKKIKEIFRRNYPFCILLFSWVGSQVPINPIYFLRGNIIHTRSYISLYSCLIFAVLLNTLSKLASWTVQFFSKIGQNKLCQYFQCNFWHHM